MGAEEIVIKNQLLRSLGTSRRQLLRQAVGLGLGLPFVQRQSLRALAEATARPKAPPPVSFSPEDEQFLDDLERSSFLFFWEQANPQTGLIKDRCNARTDDTGVRGQHRLHRLRADRPLHRRKARFHRRMQARDSGPRHADVPLEQAAQSPRLFLSLANIDTGERVLGFRSLLRRYRHPALRHPHLPRTLRRSRRSPISRTTFSIASIGRWLSEDTSLLPHGWTPEVGFLPYRWDYYSELMMMYLLGMGSPTLTRCPTTPGMPGSA